MINEILKKVKEDLEKKKKEYSFDWLGRSLAYNNYPPRDIAPFLKSTQKEPLKQIHEIKKKDEKGDVKLNLDTLVLAQKYEKIETSLISVSTSDFFDGDVEDLTAIRRYVKTPILRYDFIFDEYQLLESVVYGADSVNLMAKILTKKQLKDLLDFSRRLGMEAMVEISNKQDLTKAIFAGAHIICISHLNWEDLCIDLALSEKLIPMIPNGKIIVSQNGVKNEQSMQNLGIDAYFVKK